MKTITIADLRSYKPCYDPKRYFAEDWTGTAVDILNRDDISFEDRLWAVLRTELVSEKLMRLFAVWCARQVQHLMTDPRSIAALDVAERFANGQATKEELDAARDAAWDAVWVAAGYAARDAAWNAARTAAREAARDAQKKKLIEMIEAENAPRNEDGK